MIPEEVSVEINQRIMLVVDNEIGDFIKQELVNQDFFNPEYACKLNIKKIAEALEKQIPKRPTKHKDGYKTYHWDCPVCGGYFVSVIDGNLCAGKQYKYCFNCGQAIDWSDEK